MERHSWYAFTVNSCFMGFFDFGTVHFSTGLFSLEVEVLDRLTMALDSPMVSHYRRLAGSRIGYIGWGYFLFALRLPCS